MTDQHLPVATIVAYVTTLDDNARDADRHLAICGDCRAEGGGVRPRRRAPIRGEAVLGRRRWRARSGGHHWCSLPVAGDIGADSATNHRAVRIHARDLQPRRQPFVASPDTAIVWRAVDPGDIPRDRRRHHGRDAVDPGTSDTVAAL
jgi:hypothetical protein